MDLEAGLESGALHDEFGKSDGGLCALIFGNGFQKGCAEN